MPVLTDEQRREAWVEWIRKNELSVGITKTQLRAAVDAADSWTDSNAASFNAALPEPARSSLSAKQKAMLLTYVVGKRFEVTP